MYAGLTLVTPAAAEPISVADVKAHSRIDISVDDGMIAGYIAAARQKCESILNRALLTQTWRLALKHWPGRRNVTGGDRQEQYYKHNFIELPRPPLQSITAFTYADVNGNPAAMSESYNSAAGNYILDLEAEPGRIYLPFSGLWPTTILAPGSPILITYKAGYASFAGTATSYDGVNWTWATGDKFSALMAGTFIQIGDASCTVLTITDAGTKLTTTPRLDAVGVLAPEPTGTPYTANAVPHAIKQAILFTTAHFYENREMVVVGHVAQIATQLPFAADALLADYRNYHPIQLA